MIATPTQKCASLVICGNENVAKYSATEFLRDGRAITLRAIQPDDRTGLVAAVEQSSTESLYRRFFRIKREFTEKEIAYFVDVDFAKHVALVATVEDGERSVIVGGGRYVVTEPGIAKLAFAVIDRFQGQGIGPMLLRHLIGIAHRAGLKRLIADVLPDNTPMLKVFVRSGVPISIDANAYETHIVLELS